MAGISETGNELGDAIAKVTCDKIDALNISDEEKIKSKNLIKTVWEEDSTQIIAHLVKYCTLDVVSHTELQSILTSFWTSVVAALTTTPIVGNGSLQPYPSLPVSINISSSKKYTIQKN